MFHSYCSSGWKILKFLEKVETSGAIFAKLETQQTEYVKFINILKWIIELESLCDCKEQVDMRSGPIIKVCVISYNVHHIQPVQHVHKLNDISYHEIFLPAEQKADLIDDKLWNSEQKQNIKKEESMTQSLSRWGFGSTSSPWLFPEKSPGNEVGGS